MKYLKKFNELKSSTYRTAANRLKGLGHNRRAAAMTDYVATVEDKERIEKIKDSIKKYAHTGVFKASVVHEKVSRSGTERTVDYINPLAERGIEGEMTGNFHIALWFDEDVFHDRIWDYIAGENGVWLNFTLGIVPADEETASWFCTKERGVVGYDFYWGGIYSPNRPFSKITNDAGNFDPRPIGNENWESDKFVFEGRQEAVKFRKLMIDIFEERVEMPQYRSENPVEQVKKALASLPTFDKVAAVKRILAKYLPDNRFEDKAIKETIARTERVVHNNAAVSISHANAVEKLIDSSGGEWNREDATPEVVAKIAEEISAMIGEMTEAQYKLFLENSVRQIKLNDFYR